MQPKTLGHRTPRLALSLLVAFALIVMILPSASAAGEQPNDAITFTLMHNNDGESKLINQGAGLEDFGGIARFATVVNNVRAQIASDPNHVGFLVSSGDNFLAGSQWSASLNLPADQPYYDSKGMDLIGYDVLAIGNHEFDFGPDVTARFLQDISATQPPVVNANIDVSGEPALQALADAGRIVPSKVIVKGGQSFGFVGVIYPNLMSVTSPRNVTANPDLVGTVQAQVNALLAQGVNKIILITHLQDITEDFALLTQLHGVDIAVSGGGDNTLANAGDLLVPGDVIEYPYPAMSLDADGRNVPVITTSGEYKYVGRLDVTFDANGVITNISDVSGPIRVAGGSQPDAVTPDPAVQAQVVDPVQTYVSGLASHVIATSEVALDGRRDSVRGKETNEGNLLADSMLWSVDQLHGQYGLPAPDIAMTNGGGIRNNNILPAGPFTEKYTFDIAPFSNYLVEIPNVTPAAFKALLEHVVAFIDPVTGLPVGSSTGRFAQIAGFRYTYRVPAPVGQRVIEAVLDDGTVMVQNGQLAPTARPVNIASIDFLANGGDLWNFGTTEYVRVGRIYQQALAEYITAPTTIGGLGGLISAAQYPVGGEGRIIQNWSPEGNLVLNPGFEQSGGQRGPWAWFSEDVAYAWESGVKHSGTYAVSVELPLCDGGLDGICVSRWWNPTGYWFDLAGAGRLNFGGYVKADNLSGFASFRIQFVDAANNWIAMRDVMRQGEYLADFDWTRLDATAFVPAGAVKARMDVVLVGTGKLWFDDVYAVPLPLPWAAN